MSFISLKSSDGEIFKVDIKAAKMSETIKIMLEDLGSEDDGEAILMPKVNSEMMRLVIDWTTYRIKHPVEKGTDDDSDDEYLETRSYNIDPWSKEFLKPLDTATLLELLMVCNYLHIKDLTSATAKTIANLIKGKSPKEIRKVFNVGNPEKDNVPSNDNAVVS